MAKAKGKNGKAPKLQEFKKRPCQLAGNLNGRIEFQGEDEVPAADISISGFMLAKDELNELFGDPHTHDAWFNKSGPLTEPTDWVKRLSGAFPFFDKFENCAIGFLLGTADELLTLNQVRIAKIRLTPSTGGWTEMAFQVQISTEDEEAVGKLWLFMGREIDAELTLGNVKGEDAPKVKAKDQPELPMDHKADGGEARAH